MGFEEAFVFVVVGFVASYCQRSPSLNTTKIIFLWIGTIALPCLAIAWVAFNQTSLHLTFAMTGYLLGIWIYHNWLTTTASTEVLSLTPSEEKQLKECFSPTIYHHKDLEYRAHEIYCRGSLRSQNYKYAYETISQNIHKIFGDRFLCYLQESPIENLGRGFGVLSNDQQSTKYCFYLIPQQNVTQIEQSRPNQQSYRCACLVSIMSILLTACTVLLVGAHIHHLEDLTLDNLKIGIPYLICIASIAIARLIAYWAITSKHKLRFEPIILLPCFGGFGLLGHFHLNPQISTNPNNQRQILFDLAVIPTVASLVISTILLILGNWLLVPMESANSTMTTSLLMPNLHNFDSKNSIFVTLLQSMFAIGESEPIVTNATESIRLLSPLTLAGWTGLGINALQLLPFRFLDGGNLSLSMFSYRQTTQIARIARIILLAIALLAQPWLRIYSLLLFLLPIPQPLVVNESIEIDKTRDLIGIGLMVIALLIILPMTRL
ncbi:MAG: site-2 protease family protein [Pseudanabaena sp.]